MTPSPVRATEDGVDGVRFDAITKVYPPDVVALDRVSATVRGSSIHAFVGENGAGKSTLMKVLSGEVEPDSGTLTVLGRAVRYRSAREAMHDGIGMVHQEILLVSELTVWENVVLGVEPVVASLWGLGRVDRAAARVRVQASIDAFGLALDPDAVVGDLSVAARQKVEICKLLHRDVRILILDEPTAVLTPQEVPQLFAELRRLRDSGRTVCFVSHHLDEVLDLSDRVTVLRDGAIVDSLETSAATMASLARLMVERDVVLTARRAPRLAGAPVLVVRALTVPTRPGLPDVGPIELTVRAGEIVGVAGVEGNGQSELVAAVTGSRPSIRGTAVIDGNDVTHATVLSRRRWMAFVPADRKTEGGAPTASIVDNTTMTHHRLTAGFSRLRGRWLDRRHARRFAEDVRTRFAVASSSIDQPLGSLSGGNQQKAILGRELLIERPFVLLDQPTRGLDVGSIEYVHERILQMRDDGRAVLLVSADLDELLRLSDRIVVLRRGLIVLDVASADATQAILGSAMLETAPAGATAVPRP